MMSAALLTFVIAITLPFAIGFYLKSRNGICTSKKRLDGKTAIVTGGTSGIGLEIAKDFAERGAKLIVACPFEDEGRSAKEEITETTGSDNVRYMYLNLADLKSVREFAAEILKTEGRLDILVNNAGVGLAKDHYTKDGINFVMQVNYFGHFLLTILLLPLLRKTGTPTEPSRIVNTSSILHWIGKLDFDKLNVLHYWYKIQVYGNSKICFVSASQEFKNRLKGANVVINSVDPGYVGTRIFKTAGSVLGTIAATFLYYFSKTPWEGAQSGIHASVDMKAGKVNGQLFSDCKVVQGKASAYDSKTAKKLFEESVRLVKVTEEELEKAFKL